MSFSVATARKQLSGMGPLALGSLLWGAVAPLFGYLVSFVGVPVGWALMVAMPMVSAAMGSWVLVTWRLRRGKPSQRMCFSAKLAAVRALSFVLIFASVSEIVTQGGALGTATFVFAGMVFLAWLLRRGRPRWERKYLWSVFVAIGGLFSMSGAISSEILRHPAPVGLMLLGAGLHVVAFWRQDAAYTAPVAIYTRAKELVAHSAMTALLCLAFYGVMYALDPSETTWAVQRVVMPDLLPLVLWLLTAYGCQYLTRLLGHAMAANPWVLCSETAVLVGTAILADWVLLDSGVSISMVLGGVGMLLARLGLVCRRK